MKRTQDWWDWYLLGLAAYAASASKDPDRKVGAVLVRDRRVLGLGYNGFPADVEDSPSLLGDRELKLRNMVHAEDNLLRNAPGRHDGAAVYMTRFPCWACANLLLKVGVAEVVSVEFDANHHRWGADWSRAYRMLNRNLKRLRVVSEAHFQQNMEEPL